MLLPRTASDVPATRTRQRGWLMRRLLAGADVAGLLAAALVAELVVGNRGAESLGPLAETAVFVATLPLWLLCAGLFGLYDRDEERANHSSTDDLVRVFLLVTVGAWLTTLGTQIVGYAQPELPKMAIFWGTAVLAMTLARVAVRAIARTSETYRQRTLIVGAGDVGQLVARKLLMHPEYGIDLVGLVDSDPKPRTTWLQERVPLLGAMGELEGLVASHGIERVVFAYTSDSHEELLTSIRRLRDSGVQVDLVPRFFEVMGPRVDVHNVEGLELVGLAPVRLSRGRAAVKRTIDVLVAGTALLLLTPMLAIISVLVWRSSPGPVFFRQERLGKGMRPFKVLKFRTMRVGTSDGAHRDYIASSMQGGAGTDLLQDTGVFKLDQSDSVTGIGAWLRKTSLDELPQLINVLRGDMSLVGPRPCLAWETEHFETHHFDRFLVPAGVTGLWQVSARAQATFREALDLDVLYAHSASIGLDLRLLLRTPVQLLRPRTTA